MGSHGAGATSKQDLATDIKLGMRMPSFKVLNQADARPWHFQELLKSNGRWRLVIFAGDIQEKMQHEKIQHLGKKLDSSESFLRRFTPANKPIDSLVEVLAVHSSPRHSVDVFQFPSIFRPYTDVEGYDYWKIFVDDQSYHEGHGQAYENYGVDPKAGCAVILRPDQYVSWVGAVDDYEQMDKYFSAFMRAQSKPNSVKTDPAGSMPNGASTNGVKQAEKVTDSKVAADSANGTL